MELKFEIPDEEFKEFMDNHEDYDYDEICVDFYEQFLQQKIGEIILKEITAPLKIYFDDYLKENKERLSNEILEELKNCLEKNIYRNMEDDEIFEDASKSFESTDFYYDHIKEYNSDYEEPFKISIIQAISSDKKYRTVLAISIVEDESLELKDPVFIDSIWESYGIEYVTINVCKQIMRNCEPKLSDFINLKKYDPNAKVENVIETDLYDALNGC